MFLSKKSNIYACLILLSSLSHSLAMNETKKITKKSILPCNIIDVYDMKKRLKTNRKRVQKLAACNMRISPSAEDLVIGAEGEVYHLSLTKKAPAVNKLNLLFGHSKVNCSPILTLAQSTNKPLIIASAGNFESPDSSSEWHSSIIIYDMGNGSYRQKQLNHPVQSLQLNSKGNFLAVGGLSSVSLINLNNNPLTVNAVIFPPAFIGYPLRHITICPNYPSIISASQSGKIQLASIGNDNTLFKTQEADYLSNIQEIHCPTDEEIVILSDPHEVRLINIESIKSTIAMNDLSTLSLSCDLVVNTMTPIEKFIVPSVVIAYSKKYEQTTLNTDKEISSAHWTTNNNASEKARHKIEVCCFNNQQQEKYILEAPGNQKTYLMQLPTGQLEQYNERFFTVALCNRYVAAMSSCGKIFVWQLPPHNSTETTTTTTAQTDDSTEQTSQHNTRKRRSRSFGHAPDHQICRTPSSSDVPADDIAPTTTSTTTTVSTETTKRSSAPRLNIPTHTSSKKPSKDSSPRNLSDKRITRRTPGLGLTSSSPSSHSQSPRKEDDKQ